MVVSVKKTSQVFDTFNPTHPNNIGCLSLPNLMVENWIMSFFQGISWDDQIINHQLIITENLRRSINRNIKSSQFLP